jgi:hypothetical protein
MGSRSLAVIHCEPAIPWQPRRAAFFAEGFKAAGIEVEITSDRFRHGEGFPVLLGTSMWRDIEGDDGEYLLVDRCSFGSTETSVQLVWNGHGRRGDHRVPENIDASRWEKHGVEVKEWIAPDCAWRELVGRYEIVVCGQTETYSPDWPTLPLFYSSVGMNATAFRPHPAGGEWEQLKTLRTWENVAAGIVLNSSVGCEMLMRGIRTWALDAGAMCFPVASNEPTMDIESWCHWLAWTQWTDDEIKEGKPWAYLL